MLSVPADSGGVPLSSALRKSSIVLTCSWVTRASVHAGTSTGFVGRKNPVSPWTTLAVTADSPSQSSVPSDPMMRQDASQLVLAPSAAQEPR